MTLPQATVFIVDDDPSVRSALARLVTSVGLQAQTFASARDFLSEDHPEMPRCLVLDMRMPGLSGLDLQKSLASAGLNMPIIFITGHGSVPMSVRAMKAGAVDFLQKPFDDQALLDAIQQAIRQDRQAHQEQMEIAEIPRKMDSLTPREREVFALVVTGMLNKQISTKLGISEKTVKVHRARVMQKMGAESLADLVRAGYRAGISGS